YLEDQWREGRPLYLATGADTAFAERVSGHLGIFQGVLGTSAQTNLTSERKLSRLKSHFDEFDYIGNSRADLAVLAGAREAMIANPTLGLRLSLRLKKIAEVGEFVDRRPAMRTVVKAARVHQWAKNVLLFAPL